MRVVVTGSNGRLGLNAAAHAAAAGHDVVAVTREQLDLSEPLQISAQLLRLGAFDALINCAAWTAVDNCELEPEKARDINGRSVGEMAAVAEGLGARFLQVSTDYVFTGKSTGTYAETDPVDPVNEYGASKLLGEQLAAAAYPSGAQMIRTAWLYGDPGRALVEMLVDKLRAGEQVRIVNDQFGQPTWAGDLAAQLVTMLDAPQVPGVYHGTNAGETSWFGLAQEIARLVGADPQQVSPMSASELQRPAPRPARTVLSHEGWDLIGIAPMQEWQFALAQYIGQRSN